MTEALWLLLQEILRARHLSLEQITALEDAWRQNPDVTVDEIEKPSADEEAAPVALMCGALLF